MTQVVTQAIVVRSAAGPRVTARSPGFPFAFEELALRTVVQFGQRPPGVRCPAAVFAVPFGSIHAAVVQAADRGDGPDPPIGFRFLVFERDVYAHIGDPFHVDERMPATWPNVSELPDLTAEEELIPPRRTAAGIRAIQQAGDGPLLFGAAQALLDGGHVAVIRSAPDRIARDVWQLLPTASRAELWPASFAFAPGLPVHFTVLPTAAPGFLSEEQAKDYPEGRYELALQSAAESDDQAEVDRLFARRTSKDVLRLALFMVIGAFAVVAILKLL